MIPRPCAVEGNFRQARSLSLTFRIRFSWNVPVAAEFFGAKKSVNHGYRSQVKVIANRYVKLTERRFYPDRTSGYRSLPKRPGVDGLIGRFPMRDSESKRLCHLKWTSARETTPGSVGDSLSEVDPIEMPGSVKCKNPIKIGTFRQQNVGRQNLLFFMRFRLKKSLGWTSRPMCKLCVQLIGLIRQPAKMDDMLPGYEKPQRLVKPYRCEVSAIHAQKHAGFRQFVV